MGQQIRRFSLITPFLLIILLPPPAIGQIFQMHDIGLETGFQDTVLGHHKRSRANIAADFDLDGYIDFFIGNPGDESYIMRNVPGQGGNRAFVLHQILTIGERSWGGVAFDYDNDGDYDLFISVGANEGIGFDHLYRNEWIIDGIETGVLSFTDVTDDAGVAGPIPDGETEPIPTASANAVVADYDQDGDDDIFVNGNIQSESLPEYPELIGRNTLWRNNADGTFTDVTVESGLSVSLAPTRHSTFLDYDNDGDADLYENNFSGDNILWRNNADGTFTDVTLDMSAPGNDLSKPTGAFASGAADFNNDGWEDIIAFKRGGPEPAANLMMHDCSGGSMIPFGLIDITPRGNPPGGSDGHALFINNGGTGFEDLAGQTILNHNYVAESGVMGCMVGDVNNDGTPDVYIGNGGPPYGVADQFYVSRPGTFGDIVYEDRTSLIDYESEIPEGFPAPPYPYRTHGTAFVDIDNDGQLEIAVVNGGPAASDESKREPNRLFVVKMSTPTSTFRVRPIGNGLTVSRDAIGTRISLRVRNESGNEWTIYRTLFAGSCFSAQNGFQLHFGLADAVSIEEMNIIWPDGTSSSILGGLAVNGTAEVWLDSLGNTIITGTESEGGVEEVVTDFRLDQNYPNPFNPTTTIGYSIPRMTHVKLEVFNVLGERVRVLTDGVQEAGYHSVVFESEALSSGSYFYRLQARDFVDTKQLVLVR